VVRSGVGIGQLLLRINQFNECQAKRPAENHMQFWRDFVDEFFFNRATYKYIVWLTDHDTRSFQLFQLGIETLPRFYNVIYSSSISSVYYILENPREYCLDSRTYLLFSPKTRVEYKYDNGCRVITKGFLRVTFSDELKIILWEFEAKCHEEYFPTSIFREKRIKQQQRTSLNINANDSTPNNNISGGVISLDSLPNSQVNQFGLPPPVMRCFEITEVINYMKDLIDFALERQLAPHESLELYHKEIIDKTDEHSLHPTNDHLGDNMDLHLPTGFEEIKKETSPQKKPEDTENGAHPESNADQIHIKEEPKEKQEEKKPVPMEKAESEEDSDKTPKRTRSQNALFPTPMTQKPKRKKK